MRTPSLLSALITILAACSRPTPSTTPAPTAPSAGVDIAGSPRAALVTVVLWPDRWSDASSSFAALLGDAPHGELAALVASRPEALLAVESPRWEQIATDLANLDRTRPVVLRLFEPRIDGLRGVLRVAEEGDEPYRHVVLLPSERPAELATELGSRLDCPLREGAFVCRHRIALAPRDGELVVVIDGDASDVAERSVFERDPGDTPLAALLDATSLRDVGTGEGAAAVHRALANVTPEDRDRLRIAGLAELAGAYLRTSARGREIGAARIWLEPGGNGRVRFEAQLTEEGVARLAAPAGERRSDAPSVVHVRTSLPVAAIRARAGVPFGYGGLTSTGDHVHALQACGFACFWQTLAAPFAHATLIRDAGVLSTLSAPSVAIDDTLPSGRLDVDVDFRRFAEADGDLGARMIADTIPTLHLRTRVRGARWAGVVSREVDAEAPAPSDGAALPSAGGEPASLACLERLGETVSAAMRAYVRVEETMRPQIVERAEAECRDAAACVTDPRLAGERDEWLEMLARMR